MTFLANSKADALRSPHRVWVWLSEVFPAFHYRPHNADQFESVTRGAPASMAGHAFNTAIAVFALWGSVPIVELLIWATVSLVTFGYVFFRSRESAKRASRKISDGRRKELRVVITSVVSAAPWAYLILRYLGSLDLATEAILIAFAVGMAASGAVLLAPVERAAATYVTTILAASTIKTFLLLGSSQYILLGFLTISYWAFLLALIATTNRVFVERSKALESLEVSLAETSAARVQIEHQAMHDSLTGLINRRGFLQKLKSRIAEAKSGKPGFAVFFLDLDRFKTVNDTLGHGLGDGLLQLVAERLSSCTRQGDQVARLGGDEFSILVEQVSTEDDAKIIAARLQNNLSKPFVVDGHSINIGVSIGIAIPDGSADSQQLMKCADLAMYEVKNSGRNNYLIFESQMAKRMEFRRSIEMGLKQALAEQEFELHFQPIVRLSTMEIVRFEALIRWRHPTQGLLKPIDFLPIAEELGLMGDIGGWVLNESCRCAAHWPETVAVSVNLSPNQVSQSNLISNVRSALVRSGLCPHRLEIEITEDALLNETHQVLDTMQGLKALGISLSMDDFGTGFSSLSYLASFPFDGLKIDKAFITRYAAHKEAAEVMRAMVGLAKTLNQTSTVEGIETDEHLRAAMELGATYGQGYLIAPPLSAQGIPDLPYMPFNGDSAGPMRNLNLNAKLATQA